MANLVSSPFLQKVIECRESVRAAIEKRSIATAARSSLTELIKFTAERDDLLRAEDLANREACRYHREYEKALGELKHALTQPLETPPEKGTDIPRRVAAALSANPWGLSLDDLCYAMGTEETRKEVGIFEPLKAKARDALARLINLRLVDEPMSGLHGRVNEPLGGPYATYYWRPSLNPL